jgi:diadenosine tetraphosphate (Ap4A) HIT family hydrolase
MLKVLIESGGYASIREIAAAFLSRDESQLEYYEEITKRMPGKILSGHGLVRREKNGSRLIPAVQDMTREERNRLRTLCDEAVEAYLEKRGKHLYDHRRTALGEISGTDRYEVLRQAGFRCLLCGVPAEERALEVDHIIPRKHGGTDDLSNLQALCWKCNANKGARDDTDFRQVREHMRVRELACVFCELNGRIVAENELALAIRDRFPVTPLHTLVISRRHVPTYFDLYEPERRAIGVLLNTLREDIVATDQTVKGFNIGLNDGEVAGQTVPHCHVHLIAAVVTPSLRAHPSHR